MSAEPFECNNPAGRLYQNFKSLTPFSNSPTQLTKFVQALGIEETWESAMCAVIGMREDFQLLTHAIEEVKVNPEKYSLYKENLSEIEKSLQSFNINMSNNSCQCNIISSAIVALRFIAADFPKEESVPGDQLEQLRKLCDELRQEILNSADLSGPLKAWLLDLVRLMRDSIDRYKIRGSRGMRKQLYEMLGSMMVHWEYVEEAKQKAPSVWTKTMEGLDRVVKMAKNVEMAAKAIGYVKKAIEYFSGHSSPPALH